METFDVDTTVVGAGVVGIAIARALAMAGRQVLLIEKNERVGEETSARNSEVVHAGIYYPEGSNKARMCVDGKGLLYRYCESNGIAHRNCGKIIVACTEAEVEKLAQIASRAQANGVDDLRFLNQQELSECEPHITAKAGLLSPSTGIIDSHSFMLTMLGEAEAHGAKTLLRARVVNGRVLSDGRIKIDVTGQGDMRLRTRTLINSAGLGAAKLTKMIGGAPTPPKISFVKGRYCTYSGQTPFSHLIYPVPRDGGLGVHLTLDMAGQAKFGPDTQALDTSDPDLLDYTVDKSIVPQFADEIRKYWKTIDPSRLHAGYSGVRTKIADDSESDFRLAGPAHHGIGPHVFLYGIESPGLTCSLAIAEEVVTLLSDQ